MRLKETLITKTRRKPVPRLKDFPYRGSYAYHVVITCHDRSPVLTVGDTPEEIIHTLIESARKFGFHVIAYCLMPDHAHLLVEGGDTSPFLSFMRHFKQLSSYAYKRRMLRPLWQRSYLERVLRTDESVQAVSRYIWSNPLHAGIVADLREYPYSGPKPLPNF